MKCVSRCSAVLYCTVLYCTLDVFAVFPQAGNVKYVDLFQEAGGRSKGCAVVEYETPQEAHAAIRNLHDTELKGRTMFIREDREEVMLARSACVTSLASHLNHSRAMSLESLTISPK